jgi:hypothetical protein
MNDETYTTAHLQPIEDANDQLVGLWYYCSAWCHRDHMKQLGRDYYWNGCHEVPAPQRCHNCGNTI